MFSLNKAQILGNATRDPEVRYTPSGQAVANFGVATNRRWRNAQGEQQEDTQFHDIVAWGKLAEIIAQIVKKGSRVYVEGRLQTRDWEGKDGLKRKTTEIIAEHIQFGPRAGGASFASSTPSSGLSAPGPVAAIQPAPAPDLPVIEIGEDIKAEDLPF